MANKLEQYAKDLLLLTMRNYSQYHWSNYWINDLEYDLWAYACGDADEMWKTGFGSGLKSSDKDRLLDLAIDADGWYTWPDNGHEEKFVPMKTWLKMYQQWKDI